MSQIINIKSSSTFIKFLIGELTFKEKYITMILVYEALSRLAVEDAKKERKRNCILRQ